MTESNIQTQDNISETQTKQEPLYMTVSADMYKQLLKDSAKMLILEKEGVDQWERYDEALETSNEEHMSYQEIISALDNQFAALERGDFE